MSSRTLRSLPAAIDGYGAVDAFCGRCRVPPVVTRSARPLVPAAAGGGKRLASLDACGVAAGATLSFHHHLRNGDQVLNPVLAAAARRGLRGLTVAASSLFPVHAPPVGHIERGVVARLVTSYMSGPVAEAVSAGALRAPVVERIAHDTERARRLGFGAELCIHPRQVDAVNRGFSPSAAELDWAERVVAAMARAGGAAVAVDGKMVDRPVLRRAEALLRQRAR